MRTAKWFALTLAAGIATGGLLTLSARAAESAPAHGLRNGALRERLKQKLGLTDDQVAQIKEQLKSEKDTLKPLLTRMHDARVALREEISKPDATEASVRAAVAKVSSVEADLAVERLKLRGKISPILTAEQREKLAELRKNLDKLGGHLIERARKRLDD